MLVSDLAMPSEDGFDLIRTIRCAGRTARDLPAIALTAFSTKPVRRQTMLAGFQMHVPKPVDPCQLTEVVATFAGAHRIKYAEKIKRPDSIVHTVRRDFDPFVFSHELLKFDHRGDKIGEAEGRWFQLHQTRLSFGNVHQSGKHRQNAVGKMVEGLK